jgi:hypothetical protein
MGYNRAKKKMKKFKETWSPETISNGECPKSLKSRKSLVINLKTKPR